MATDPTLLSLDPQGDGFVLRRKTIDGKVFTMELSELDVLTLAQHSAALQQQVLARHEPKSKTVSAIAATLVADVEISPEMMGENMLLAMVSLGGGRTIFAIPTAVAHTLIAKASVQLEKMLATRPTRQ